MESGNRMHLDQLKAKAEEIYNEMYKASSPVGAGAYFSEVKEILNEAITIARNMGLEEEVKAIESRLDNIRKVYESQMQ